MTATSEGDNGYLAEVVRKSVMGVAAFTAEAMQHLPGVDV